MPRKDKCTIIAEVGECWNGELEQAKKLIKIAAEAGCDYVKFQTLDACTVSADDPEYDWFLKIALTDENISLFIDYSKQCNIKPLFTPANLNKAMLLKNKFGLTEAKIASSVVHNPETVDFISKNYSRVFVSTGMCSLDELNDIVYKFSNTRELFLLHCISEYPTGPLLDEYGLKALDEKNCSINMMKIMKQLYPHRRIGYSDHTSGILAPVVAVAAGAEIIEKHITLDRKKPIELFNGKTGYLGTDHVLSLEPAELKEMVKQIRRAEEMLGDWRWERTPGEKKLKDFLVRRF